MSPRQAPPRPRGILLRLMVLVTAAALAVFMQAGAGASSGTQPAAAGESAAPGARPESQRLPGCAGPAEAGAALNHPALARAVQPSADSSKRPSSDCSREAKAGS